MATTVKAKSKPKTRAVARVKATPPATAAPRDGVAEGVPEGSVRGPFYGYGELGGVYPFDPLGDGWQPNITLGPWAMRGIPVIEAIRHLHRSAFAQLTPHHYEKVDRKTNDRIDTAPIRTLLFPNSYETWAEYSARIGDEWVYHGDVLTWGIRNSRTEIASMHIVPYKTWMVMVEPVSKEIFYLINQSGELLQPSDATIMVPARDVLHLRWATPRHPLIGEGPFANAGLVAGVSVALSASQIAFFKNMRRPSGILSTDQPLNRTQMGELRAAFDLQSKDLNVGGVPILAYGLKFQQMGINPEDAKVIDTLRMGNEELARCAGVPPPLIGDLTHSAPGNTTEALMSWWLSISLGGLIERFERGLDRLFELNSRTAWIDLDTTELLRMELGKRMEALGKGVQNGILTPDEARERSLENLSPIEGGEGAFMQRQMTPVALLAQLAAAELKKAEAPPAPPPGASPSAAPEGDEEPPPPEEGDEDVARALSRDLIQRIRSAQ